MNSNQIYESRQVDFHRWRWLFSNQDSSSHEPTLIQEIIQLCHELSPFWLRDPLVAEMTHCVFKSSESRETDCTLNVFVHVYFSKEGSKAGLIKCNPISVPPMFVYGYVPVWVCIVYICWHLFPPQVKGGKNL